MKGKRFPIARARIWTLMPAGLLWFGLVLAPALLRAQTRMPGYRIAKIEITVQGKAPVSFRDLEKNFRGQPASLAVLKSLQANIQNRLQDAGYYFAQVVPRPLQRDSLHHRVSLTYLVEPGKPTIFTGLVLTDSSRAPRWVRDRVQELVQARVGKPYRRLLLQHMFEEVVSLLENRGFPLARLETVGLRLAGDSLRRQLALTLHVHLDTGDSVIVSSLRIPRRASQHLRFLQRVLRFKPGQPYRERDVQRYLRQLRHQEFIQDVQSPQLIQTASGQYQLFFPFKEAPSTSFDGIVGYIPPSSSSNGEKGFFTGLINIGVRNLFGTGRKLKIFWQKQDRFSEQFQLRYREPFVAGLPLHAEAGFRRLVRDTTFIEWEYDGLAELPVGDRISFHARISTRSVFPDTLASRRIRLPRTREIRTETGIRWDARDDPLNPRTGVLMDLAFSLGRQENLGPGFLLAQDSLPRSISLKRFRGDLEWLLPAFTNQVLANHLHAEAIGSSGRQVLLPDKIWFGGATTVRGFRESQFVADRVLWLNTEYRFLLAEQSRFFLFTDNAYFENRAASGGRRVLTSYGLGIRFRGPMGTVEVDYGLEKGAPFREGKIHFRLVNAF